ncbi:MAG: DUF1540 domain-containing protein [Chitinispirillales bacterium]|nr:DUF1540 domain-containing protein [Chitinispirillales bacterium]
MMGQMTKIIDCDALQCIYNKDKLCHTLAINVGDDEPICDTFMSSSTNKGGFQDVVGGVGSCKVQDCEYNKSFECTAVGIHVTMQQGHPDCVTYKPR